MPMTMTDPAPVCATLRATAATALAVAALVSVRWIRTSDMDAVVTASAKLRYRPSLARLSPGFPYREVAPQTRGNEKPSFLDPRFTQLAQVIARLQSERPPQFHALGVSYLLAGDVTLAVESFERALRSETGGRGEIVEAIRR